MVADRPRSRALIGVCLVLLLALAGSGERTMQAQVIDQAPRKSLMRAAVKTPHEVIDDRAAVPVRIRIPEIGTAAPVGPLRVDERGSLVPPDANGASGWWRDGPEPGERGPAVVAGHVDSYRGPAVFFRLPDLPAGARVFIDRADRTTAVFTVYRVEKHPKNVFPTRAVYGRTPDSELRIITCGGDFDDADKSYLANVIVFARRTS